MEYVQQKGWNKVSEELPKEFEDIIIKGRFEDSVDFEIMFGYMAFTSPAQLLRPYWLCYTKDGTRVIEEVTHWMAKPEPPYEE